MKYKIAKISIKKALVTLLSILALSAVWGQPYCRVKTFSISQGLTTNHITHIDQDDNGLMWFSSVNGLWSFDGYEFMPYRDYGDFHTITTQRYLSLRPNHNGGIYLTDNNRQLYLYDCRTNSFHCLSKILRQKGINMKVLDIMPLPNGNTWLIGMRETSPGLVRICDRTILKGDGIDVVSNKPLHDATYRAVLCSDGSEIIYGKIGVYAPGRGQIYQKAVLTLIKRGKELVWGGDGNRITIYSPQTKKMTGFALPAAVNEINNMVALDSRRIACGTNTGVAVVDMATHTAQLINLQNPASPSNHVTNLFLDSSHRLWAFTESDGLTLIMPNLKDKRWMTAKAADFSKSTSAKETVWLQDKLGTIWTVPRNGTFAYFDEHSQQLVPYPLYEQDNQQYAIPRIDRSFVDKQKNLWLTGLHSFNILSFGKYNFQKVSGELFGNVRAILVDKGGNIWTGSEKGHLIIYDRNNRIKGYVSPDGKLSATPAIFKPNIYAMFEDRSGRKWIGTKDDGLFLISADGNVKNYRHVDNDPYSLSGNRANSIVQDSEGHIWIGTYGGGLNLVYEQGSKIRFINSKTGLGRKPLADEYSIRQISTTRNGAIILSTTHGLVTFNGRFKSPRDITFCYFHGNKTDAEEAYYDVIQTLVTRSGKVFMATISGEIFELDSRSLLSQPKELTRLDSSISDGPINGMLEDKHGNLWIVHENNIDCYNPSTGKSTTLWPGKQTNYSDFTEALPRINPSTGFAVIGSQDGYLTFMPDKIQSLSITPKIVFTSTLLNGDKQCLPLSNSREITLPANKHSLTVNFAALDYAEGQFIKYAYKLEGVDKQWNNIGYNHSVSFNDLSTGRYRLLVRSTNADGQWVDNTAEIVIHATPKWWETWWAKVFYLLLAGGGAYMVYKYYSIRHKATIEKIVSERKTMLYREASHKLRTPLTLIGGPIVEVLKNEKLSERGREYLETARNNSRSMLKLVDGMLSENQEGSYFVDDDNAPVFAHEDFDAREEAETATDTRILIVEDNADLRRFLVSLLSHIYSVITATNGKEGLDKAISEQPDFILSDVTMPVMDGLTMVSLIKKNPAICHIPIVILSARASVDDKVQGISQGIDDYITKPFSARYLKQRMAEIIAHRHVEQQASAEEIQQSNAGEYKLSSAKIVDYDREMMMRLMAYIEQNISNSDVRVDDMASAVNLGRTVFFNKIKSIVGMSPTDFLKSLRIKRAAEMIVKSRMTIQEISAAVGFNDQRYFSRVFKKETGLTPSEYRDKSKVM